MEDQKVIAPSPISQKLEDEDDPDTIFAKAISELDTQPLPKLRNPIRWQDVLVNLIPISMILAAIFGIIWSVITYPIIYINITPVEKTVTITTLLSLATQTRSPKTIKASLSSLTTGKGHQVARQAQGFLTFYNGEFTAQVIPGGSVFAGADGVKAVTDAQVIIPASNLPNIQSATISAHAIEFGTQGNIGAYDINGQCCNAAIKVVNAAPFYGGQNERTFQAVAQSDIDSLVSKLNTSITAQMPMTFSVAANQSVYPTNCSFSTATNHKVGEEAKAVSVSAQEVCSGLVYQNDELKTKTTDAFISQTQPSKSYTLLGSVTASLVTVTPLTATITGKWGYRLDKSYEGFLAAQIAGDAPGEAKQYLLHTGIISSVSLDQSLPKDPDYIRFIEAASF